MNPIFKNKDFHCLFWSLFFSQFGSFLFYISLLWQVQVKTGSAYAVGIIGASATIPALFSVFFGVLADRFDKKRLLLYSDAVRAIMLAVLFALASIHEPSLSIYVLAVFLISSFQALFNTTLEATIPLLFERETYVQVNSLLSTAIQVASVLGGVAAGFVPAYNFVLVINIFTYMISFIFLLFLKRNEMFSLREASTDHEKPKQNMMKEMTEGLKFLIKDQVISQIIPVALVMNIGFYAMTAILPFWTLNILHSNSKTFGMLEGAMSAGMILGGILGSLFYKKLGSLGKVFILCLGTQGALFLLFSFSSNRWISILLWGLYGIPSSLAGTTFFSILQMIAPKELLGRVFGGITMVFGIAAPIGMLVGSHLVSLADPHLIPGVEGVLLILGGIYLYRLESLRQIHLQDTKNSFAVD